MTTFFVQLLNVRNVFNNLKSALKTVLSVMVVWISISNSSMAAGVFTCNTFTTTYSAASGFKSNGTGGGQFLVSQNPPAGTVIYQGTITFTAFCGTTDSSYRLGQLQVKFGNGPYTFAGGGLVLEATGAPTVSNFSNGWCAPNKDYWPSFDANARSWDGTWWIQGMATQTSNGCTVRVAFPVRVRTTGAAVVAGSGFTTNIQAAAYDGGFWSGPNVTVSALPTACVVTPTTSTVTLPTVSQLQLRNSGDTAGAQPFAITLAGCSALATGTYLANANWSFTPGSTATTIANSATSPAGNVEIQIRDANNNPIANNATSTIATGITSGTYSANFSARYYATGQATAGNVRGVVTFNMTYQ
jgi:major type 1 subunit fimbrin (pilin)